MKFHRNQQVICIDDQFSYCRYPVTRGAIYTIDGFYRCPCGSEQLTLKEFFVFTNMGCSCNRVQLRRQTYYNWRFVPLDQLEQYLGLYEPCQEPEPASTILLKQLEQHQFINIIHQSNC